MLFAQRRRDEPEPGVETAPLLHPWDGSAWHGYRPARQSAPCGESHPATGQSLCRALVHQGDREPRQNDHGQGYCPIPLRMRSGASSVSTCPTVRLVTRHAAIILGLTKVLAEPFPAPGGHGAAASRSGRACRQNPSRCCTARGCGAQRHFASQSLAGKQVTQTLVGLFGAIQQIHQNGIGA